ncbi:MAG: YqgE/AlgH family protein [Deltaproteobacteria bacterium]|nr:MAG: YqgE/AlgH family protein [Deltaproteobacteria bacterium]
MPRRLLAPSLLVATPQLQDPNFRRAVVLMVEHDPQGSFGFVVNRESDRLAAQVCEELGVEWPGDRNARAAWGGPVVQQSGWVLFGGSRPTGCAEASEVTDGLYVTSSLDVLRQLGTAEPPPSGIRFLLGYAGWGPGQLEDELALGAWIVAPVNREAVFGMAPETIWGNIWLDLGINPATLVSSPGVH